MIRQGLIQNTPLLGIVVNNFLVLGIEEHDLTRMPIMPFLRSQRTNEGYSMPSHSVSFSVYSFSHLNCKCTRKWGIFSLVGDLLQSIYCKFCQSCRSCVHKEPTKVKACSLKVCPSLYIVFHIYPKVTTSVVLVYICKSGGFLD